MRSKTILMLTALAGLASGPAALGDVIAQDSAADPIYDFGWLEFTDGGTGFDGWLFATTSTDGSVPGEIAGFAGQFISTMDINVLASGPEDEIFTSFANSGTMREASVQFRALDSSLTPEDGTFLSVGFANGFISGQTGEGIVPGRQGVAIRSSLASDDVDDATEGALIQVFFEGGDSFYTVIDGSGELDTGIPFTSDGLIVEAQFTSATEYDLTIRRLDLDDFGSEIVFEFPGRTIPENSTIESFSFFNDDGGSVVTDATANGDFRFNNLLVESRTIEERFDTDVNNDRSSDFLDVIALLARGPEASSDTEVVFATDAASNDAYEDGFGEGTNGGSGYEPWSVFTVATEADMDNPGLDPGFAGVFLSENFTGPIATGENNERFGLFANQGDTREAVTVVRPLTTAEPVRDDLAFEIGFRNGDITEGGRVGFSLRDTAAATDVDAYEDGDFLIVEFVGGEETFRVTDAGGSRDVALPFSFNGYVFEVVFTSDTTYRIDAVRFADDAGSAAGFTPVIGNVAPGSSIASLAVFNDDGGSPVNSGAANGDVFFNSPTVRTDVVAIEDVDVNSDGSFTDADVTALLNLLSDAG